MTRQRYGFLLVLGLAVAVHAAPQDAADLPPPHSAARLIRQSPEVAAARAQLLAEEANRDRLDSGSHETSLRLESARRRVDSSNQRYPEWSVNLERPLRLPGKARLDGEIGEQGVAWGRVALGDALHESSRRLLKLWFAALRETGSVALWQRQADTLVKQAEAVAKRVKLGDASKLESLQAEAAAAQARAAVRQAEGRAAMAAAELGARFPGIATPVDVLPAAPASPAGADWLSLILEHNHELAMASAESRRAQLLAQRADAERVPDPSLGLRLGSETGGDQRIVGLSLTIPLPGSARGAVSRGQLALASAAASQEAAVRRKVQAEAASLVAQAEAAYESWLRADAAARQTRQAAQLTERARLLGEADLAQWLLAQRQAHEADLTALLARADARESAARLQLDAHQLWDLDEDGDGADGGGQR
ncbi:hypothetical protein DLREEDagrD3_20730 [Denitratisoma sp. agr-D3]